MSEREKTTDALEIIFRHMYEGRPDRIRALENERKKAERARQAREKRTQEPPS